MDSNKTNKNDAKNRIMQQKKLKNYKYKKSNAEDVFTLEDYLTQEEIEKLIVLLLLLTVLIMRTDCVLLFLTG